MDKIKSALSLFLAVIAFSAMIISFRFILYDTKEKRINYQNDAIKVYDTFDSYQKDLKDPNIFNKSTLTSEEFNLKSQTYFDKKMLKNFKIQGDYVTAESQTQMLCFAINELESGNEIDLTTYKKLYLGVIKNEKTGVRGCHELPLDPWYIIYFKI